MINSKMVLAGTVLVFCSASVLADSTRADSHAPINVMGDHRHKQGEWMFSYRFMTMDMDGNRKGTDNVDADTIVTTEANPFAGMPGMPATLRIVPLKMSMDMHMLGLMYAPGNRVTLMLMANHWSKTMQHVTYAGGMGTAELSNFKTSTSGWGDTTLTGLIGLPHSAKFKAHAILGVSFPTGSTDETDDILTPTGMTPTVRVPYPMQLGSGSYDPIVGFNVYGGGERLGWGSQWRSTFRVADNDDDYRLGDEHRATAWLSYLFTNPASGSLRLEYYKRGNISGRDPLIAGPVQTADPGRQGARRLDLAAGVNLVATRGSLHGWRLGLEYVVPLMQHVEGPQLETDSQLVVGIQKAF